MKLYLESSINTLRATLVISLTAVLGSCSFGASMPQQITSLNVDCSADTVQISNEVVDLNGEESWTANCEGKTYDCNYLPESGSGCYELE